MLTSILQNNHELLKSWIQKDQIEAYRLYDQESKEYPLTIDIYKDYSHTSIYESQNLKNIEKLAELVRQATGEVLGIKPENNFFKIRKRQKDGNQYERMGNFQKKTKIKEYGVVFNINLTDYLDTGLFLDHRESRKILPQFLGQSKRLLNLFSYTGAFSLVAALCGVEYTTSVDMSNTYCAWAKENIQDNRLDPFKHIVIRENVFFFLENIKKKNWRFDFVVIDPPTASRSKKMLRKFDIQRDHPYLIDASMEFLNRDGKIYFSTNFQKFKLDTRIQNKYKVSDITEFSFSPDFKNKKIHKVYLLEP